MSRTEEFLTALLNGETVDIEPRSRLEQYLKNCCDKCGCDGLPAPRSRAEVLLYQLAEQLASGGTGSGSGTTYTVQFVDDGIVISSQNLAYGDAITKPANPTKESTAQYHFNFIGWSLDGETVVDVPAVMGKGDVTYTAVYENELRYYTVRFLNGSTVLQESLLSYGEIPVYTGAEPTPETDYAFDGWTPNVSAVSGAVDYVAKFKSTKSMTRAIIDRSINFPYNNSTIETVGDYAFITCNALPSVSLPNVSSFGSQVFYACKNITRVTLPATPPTIKSDSFYEINSACVFHIPAGSLSAYQSATNWSSLTEKYTFTEDA